MALGLYMLGLQYGLVIGGIVFMSTRGLSHLVHTFERII